MSQKNTPDSCSHQDYRIVEGINIKKINTWQIWEIQSAITCQGRLHALRKKCHNLESNLDWRVGESWIFSLRPVRDRS